MPIVYPLNRHYNFSPETKQFVDDLEKTGRFSEGTISGRFHYIPKKLRPNIDQFINDKGNVKRFIYFHCSIITDPASYDRLMVSSKGINNKFVTAHHNTKDMFSATTTTAVTDVSYRGKGRLLHKEVTKKDMPILLNMAKKYVK